MKRSGKNLVITLAFTFVLMTLLVIFTAQVIFRTVFSSVQELGDDKTAAITADLENYLETAKSVLWMAADTVDHMVAKGATNEEVIEYITRESTNTGNRFDSSYTGIYGVINDVYVDGVGWVPPEDYDFHNRDWYLTTIGGKGDVVIVSPYVDAQTGNVIISVGRALSDGKSALALDITLSGVQEIVEEIRINGYGYGYIVNNDGMVIAHRDKGENGKNYKELAEQQELFRKVFDAKKGNFDAEIDGDSCTVFVDQVMSQWRLVIVTKNADLYKAPRFLLVVSILINLAVFILISVFYFFGYRKERKAYDRMEELKEMERKKDYEAKVLKLEKSAADSANRAKSNFLADMSHEIRTPINAILGMNEMILHESKEEQTLDYASNIKSAGNTLLSIINTILDFSKIEDGRMSLVPAEFETQELVNGLVNSIYERAKDKGLKFNLDVDPSIPSKLMGDDVRISQVIMNLLTNAVKYTEKGEVTLSIRDLGQKDKNVERLLVSVKDTGIGIRKEDMDKLAISFERVDEKKNRHIEGTGLGISIVTKLLAMMGSELKIRSEYGVGSEFYFELPIEVVDHAPVGEDTTGNTSKLTGSDIHITAPSARILLTDDNEMNCKVAANLMKLFMIKPTLCRSGRKTIDLMRENTYDILFLDHMMPEMDGLETLERLEQEKLIKGAKVIALTANAVMGAKEQYISVGFDDYLSKPIEIAELEKILRKYLPADRIVEVQAGGEKGSGEEEKKEEPSEPLEFRAVEEPEEEPEDEIMEFPADPEGGVRIDIPGRLDHLRSLGLNVEEGLRYCAGDETFYLEMVKDFVAAAAERDEKLTQCLRDCNMKDYNVLVHSLKSSAKTIGSEDLFERARFLELESAKEDLEYVRDNHGELMKKMHELVEKI